MYTINIGLNNPFTKGTNSIEFTLTKAFEFISDVTNVHVSYEGDEPTVIIKYAFHKGSIGVLATALDQDCIALYDHLTGKGSLIGDKASEWGDFNLDFFQFIRAQQIKETA
jgi:hypothetical protein